MSKHYDPLISKHLTSELPYPDSYWAHSVGEPQPELPELTNEIDTEVAIIGSGYTGMSTALHLARDYQSSPIILEANQPAWGASGRNAGFVLKGSGRLSYPQTVKRYGTDQAQLIFNEYQQAVDRVEGIIDEFDIQCDKQAKSYIKVAHNLKKFELLKAQAKIHESELGEQVDVLSQNELQQLMNNADGHGAIRYQNGFGVHPLKLAFGYNRALDSLGVKRFGNSPVIEWNVKKGFSNGKYQLVTPKGIVNANKVVIASNAYTPKRFNSLIDNRFLPVMTTIIVTQPFTDEQHQQFGLKGFDVAMDTRALKYYYRRLPDNRILFGGRGAVEGKNEFDPIYGQRLKQALEASFPGLGAIQIDYSWSGWINVSLDDMPHIYGSKKEGDIYYSSGYCGAGVSFSVQGGYRLAQKVMGDIETHAHPILTTHAPKFPFSPFRRLGQRLYYQYGRIVDSL